jgi:hypothetical protein
MWTRYARHGWHVTCSCNRKPDQSTATPVSATVTPARTQPKETVQLVPAASNASAGEYLNRFLHRHRNQKKASPSRRKVNRTTKIKHAVLLSSETWRFRGRTTVTAATLGYLHLRGRHYYQGGCCVFQEVRGPRARNFFSKTLANLPYQSRSSSESPFMFTVSNTKYLISVTCN